MYTVGYITTKTKTSIVIGLVFYVEIQNVCLTQSSKSATTK